MSLTSTITGTGRDWAAQTPGLRNLPASKEEVISNLFRETYGPSYPFKEWLNPRGVANKLSQPGVTPITIEKGGATVAFALLRREGANRAIFEKMVVKRESRNQGLGTQLVVNAISLLEGGGFRGVLTASAAASNRGSNRVFQSREFSNTATIPNARLSWEKNGSAPVMVPLHIWEKKIGNILHFPKDDFRRIAEPITLPISRYQGVDTKDHLRMIQNLTSESLTLNVKHAAVGTNLSAAEFEKLLKSVRSLVQYCERAGTIAGKEWYYIVFQSGNLSP